MIRPGVRICQIGISWHFLRQSLINAETQFERLESMMAVKKKSRRLAAKAAGFWRPPKKASKKKHHYVPRFWLRGFADKTGQIHAWDGQKVRPVSSKKIMQRDWLYTLFDNAWNPTDDLEDALGNIENVARPLFLRLEDQKASLSSSDRSHLCEFLALQACRHPDIMKRGRRRLSDFLALLALSHEFPTAEEFVSELTEGFAASANDARSLYEYLRSLNVEQLRRGIDDVTHMSEQAHELPEQDVLRAQPQIAQLLMKMRLTIIDCPKHMTFILGDTPLPQEGLARGFTIPLSKSIALEALPSGTVQVTLERRTALAAEVSAVNRLQWENSLHIVIGPDPDALARF